MRKVLLLTLFALLIAGTAYGDWVYEYSQSITNDSRGIAVFAEDDVALGIKSTPLQVDWYHNTAGGGAVGPDTSDAVWDCPFHANESVGVTWNWGLGKDSDNNIYLSNQDWTGTDGSSIMVWDYNGGEVDRFETDIDPSGSKYGTACDVDGSGYVYTAWYISTPDILIFPPMPWGPDCDHDEDSLACSFEAGAYVCEGVCVNQAGTVVWVSNRASATANGWVKRFTGDVVTGFTEDVGFSCPVGGRVGGLDVDEVNDRIFICTYEATEDVIVADASTGAHEDTIHVTNDFPTVNGIYDVEYDPVGEDVYIVCRYNDLFMKYHWMEPTAVTMSSFEAIAGEEMVDLSWRVESEVDNAGFKIYRDGDEIAFVQSQGNTDAPRIYTWVDKDVSAGVTYSYKIADVSLEGVETPHDFEATATPKASAGVPTEYWLSQNYPNPFNADTHIEFKLANAGHTTLKIYNTTGQLIRTLVDGHLEATLHKVRWDGRNEHGQLVSSGIYFYRLSSGKFAEMKKMSFLR